MKYVVLIGIDSDQSEDVVGPFDDQGLAETWIIEHGEAGARTMMRWINRNVGPEGCAAIGLLLILTMICLAGLIVGFLLFGPLLQQLLESL